MSANSYQSTQPMSAEQELLQALAQMMVNKFHAEYPEGTNPGDATRIAMGYLNLLAARSAGPVDDGGITQALVAMARANAIEECARVADEQWCMENSLIGSQLSRKIAKAIRAIDSPSATVSQSECICPKCGLRHGGKSHDGSF